MNNVKKCRAENRMSQRKLSQITGLATQTIIDIEAGRRYPLITTVYTIADALKRTPEELMGEDLPMCK